MSRYRRVLVILASAAILVGLLPGLVAAGSGIGGAFQLGIGNAVSAMTGLAATTVNPALWVKNTGPGIQITVGAGQPPIIVTGGAGKATNLNSDMLDGKDSTSFQNKLTSLSDLNGLSCSGDGVSKVLVTRQIYCVGPDTEPNNTVGTALTLAKGTNAGGNASIADHDYYHLTGVCDANVVSGFCTYTAKLESLGLVFDVYRDGSLLVPAATSFSENKVMIGSPHDYYIDVHSIASATPLRYNLSI
jgi:hypothetical protein